MLPGVKLQVNEKVYLKDPEQSELGRRIVSESVHMIDELGFEHFTFRKLACQIHSTEASVYRYFESKHKLLLYLASWYWAWLSYCLAFKLANILSPKERLGIALDLLTEQVEEDRNYAHINKVKLFRIITSESSKSYLVKEVDQENKEGVFTGYKQLVAKVSDIILEINPAYKYPHMLISTVIEGAHHQYYFAEHLPRLTNVVKGENAIKDFYKEIVFKAIGENK